MNIKSNTILLTGGTSGIGFELLRQLYDNNNIIVVSSNPSKLEKLKLEYPDITGIVCNLGNIDSVKQLIDKCLNELLGVNILINNAAIQNNYSFLSEKEGFDKIENEITINLISPLFLIYGLLPVLLKNNNAAIINISSGLAFSPKKSAPVYCGTKAAIHNITKALRYQLEDTTVKVFEIIPPLVDTPLSKGSSKSKITPKQLVSEFLSNVQKDKLENNIGKIKFLRILNRLAPKFADRLLKKG
jgi:uncharacterized oxidoreductase